MRKNAHNATASKLLNTVTVRRTVFDQEGCHQVFCRPLRTVTVCCCCVMLLNIICHSLSLSVCLF